MHGTVRDHMVMTLLVSDGISVPVPVELGYDAADPFAVALTFHLPDEGPVSWCFARELLLDGISRPCGEGDVHVHPLGGDLSDVCIRLHSPDGDALLRAAAPPLIAFLARSDIVVPMGAELPAEDIDAEFQRMLGQGRESAG